MPAQSLVLSCGTFRIHPKVACAPELFELTGQLPRRVASCCNLQICPAAGGSGRCSWKSYCQVPRTKLLLPSYDCYEARIAKIGVSSTTRQEAA